VTHSPLSPTPRSTIARGKHRAVTERAALYAVLDAGLMCHLAFVHNGAPVVLPTSYGRDGDTLYLHGSTGANSMRIAASGADVCVAVTHLDGVVYARSVFHHSVNYRCAVVHGRASEITDDEGKLHALRVLTTNLAPGSWEHARRPTRKELAATTVLALDLAEASVKIRDGDPSDDEDDIAAGVAWAGVVPLRAHWGDPVPGQDLAEGIDIPGHVTARVREAP